MKIFGLSFFGSRNQKGLSPQVRRSIESGRQQVMRSFEAATTPILTGPTGAMNINASLSSDLAKLRSMSRHEARNSPLGHRYVGLCRTNVVGPRGVVVQAQAKDPGGKLDRLANDAIENAWSEWSRPGNCSADSRSSWTDIQRLVVSTLITDGEVLVEELDAGPHRYGLRLIDPDVLDVNYSGHHGQNRVIMGVEIDSMWSPVAYHLLTDTVHSFYGVGFQRERILADRLKHIFIPEAIGQVRGVPWLVPGLLRSKMLNGFADAALTNARAGAAKMGFYESPDGEGFGDVEQSPGEFIDYAEPGHFGVLPHGYKFSSFDPTYPSGEYGTFAEDHKRDIASAWGVGYNSLTNDLRGVSYSSIRTAVLEDRETWKMLQEFLVERLVRPVFEAWLVRALVYGKVVQLGGSALPAAKWEKFRHASFQGRRWSWIDPLKDVNASVQAIQARLTSRRRVIQDMGLDADEIWQELQEEEAQFKEKASDDGNQEA